MSSISGIGGLGSDTYQLLRQIAEQGSADGANRPPRPEGMDGNQTPPMWSEIEQSAETAGLSADEVSALKDELKDAIGTALQSVDRSEGPQAGREAVDSAILSTLQDHGIDTEDLESHMAEAKQRMQNGPPPGANGMGGGSDGGISALLNGSSSDSSSIAAMLSQFFPLVDETA